jgi:hypothetical protein
MWLMQKTSFCTHVFLFQFSYQYFIHVYILVKYLTEQFTKNTIGIVYILMPDYFNKEMSHDA